MSKVINETEKYDNSSIGNEKDLNTIKNHNQLDLRKY